MNAGPPNPTADRSRQPDRSRARHAAAQAVAGFAVAALAALLAVGCQHRALADEHTQIRLTQLRRPGEVWGATERSRPERVDRMGRHVQWYFEHQAECLGRNWRNAEGYARRDLSRAEPRLRRAGDKTLEILRGKPENLEETAIILFY